MLTTLEKIGTRLEGIETHPASDLLLARTKKILERAAESGAVEVNQINMVEILEPMMVAQREEMTLELLWDIRAELRDVNEQLKTNA